MTEAQLISLGFETIEFQPANTMFTVDYYFELNLKESKNKYGSFMFMSNPASEGYDGDYVVFMADFDRHFEFSDFDDLEALIDILKRNTL